MAKPLFLFTYLNYLRYILQTFFLFQAKEFFEKSRLPIQESI